MKAYQMGEVALEVVIVVVVAVVVVDIRLSFVCR